MCCHRWLIETWDVLKRVKKKGKSRGTKRLIETWDVLKRLKTFVLLADITD